MKTFISFGISSILAGSAIAQGLVTFNNRDLENGLLAPVWAEGGGVVSGSFARCALLGGPVSSNPVSGWDPGTLQMLASPTTAATWVTFETGALAGYVAVGQDSARVVPNVPYGGQAKLQLVAWTGPFTDWQSAFAAAKRNYFIFVGCSGAWTVTTASPTDPSFPVNTGMSGFSLMAIAPPDLCMSCPPVLSFALEGENLVLRWPTNTTGHPLQTTTKLGASAVWTTVPGGVNDGTGNFTLTQPVSKVQQFYRLGR